MTNNLFRPLFEAIQRLRPPLVVIASTESGSFDHAVVELRDGGVSWRVIRERTVLTLVAAPEFDRSVWYDVDLLKRLFGYPSTARDEAGRASAEAPRELLIGSLPDVIRDLEQLRPALAAAFDESTWKTTRRQLNDLGRRRDAELFSRPSPSDKPSSPPR